MEEEIIENSESLLEWENAGLERQVQLFEDALHNAQEKIEALEDDKVLHDEAYLSQMKEIESLYYENSMLKNRHNLQQAEIEALESEIFVKDAIRRSYKEALEQIATGSIAGESNNYKDTVYVMKQIAKETLGILK